MTTAPVLTIAIPTYNRSHDLERLLAALSRELLGLDGRVNIVICDNASTDGTRGVIERFALNRSDVRVLWQDTNLGMDGNFCACAEHVDGRYFWLFGDDDLPVRNAIPALVDLLDSSDPDLLYLTSRWMPDITDAADDSIAETLDASLLSRAAFARRVHVWTTFLSGMIIKRTALLDSPQDLRRFYGTHLSQMSWVIGRLREGTRFIHVRTPCVLATGGNTGGYSAVKVFGDHFPRIVRESLTNSPAERDMARAIIFRTVLLYLPELLWNLRLARAGQFESENVEAALRPQLGRHPLTSLLLLPVSRAPMPIARTILGIARIAGRVVSIGDRFRTKLNLGGAVA